MSTSFDEPSKAKPELPNYIKNLQAAARRYMAAYKEHIRHLLDEEKYEEYLNSHKTLI
jgi:hypothetical protein